MNVAYLGIPGSYTYLAAKKFYLKDANFVEASNIKDVFHKVIEDNCQTGIIPIENSTTGSLFETYDCLTMNDLNITGEVYLSLHHQLAFKPESKKKNLKIIYSHPQAIAQCRRFLDKMTGINIINVTDTATAAKITAEDKNGESAAITSRLSAHIYGLEIGAKNIEDNSKNFTRFSIVSKNKKNNGTKVSILIKVKHIPGSLYRTLEPIAKRGINLTKIESRPIPGSIWEYIFIVDLEMTANSQSVKNLLKDLSEITDMVKILGIYEKGKIYET